MISHDRFCIWYGVVTYALYNLVNFQKIAKWFYLNGGEDYLGLAAFLCIGLFIYIFFLLLLAHRATTKPVAISFVMLGATGAYFVSKYNVAIDRTMVMNALHTDRAEVHSLLSWEMVPYLLFMMLVPIWVLLRVRLSYEKNYFLASMKIMIVVLASSVCLTYLFFPSISRAANLSDKRIVYTLVPINYLQSFGSIIQNTIKTYSKSHVSEISATGHVVERKNMMVVLAIGESARQDNFSLYGYKRRNTNPELSKVNGLHVLNGKARLGSTLYALPEILTKNDLALPAFTTKMGIDTVCYVNFTLYKNCSIPGESAVTNCAHEGKCFDEDVIPMMAGRINSYVSGYSFTVLHLGGGSHGPSYSERIPDEYHQFMPLCKDADVVNQCSVDQLYNSYDNTLLYTDHVLAKIIMKLDQSDLPYVFIYLSDHGESLLEEGRIFHGMPPGIKLPPEQARIPMFVKSSVPLVIDQRQEYAQTDIFDTILNLLSVESNVHDGARGFIGYPRDSH